MATALGRSVIMKCSIMQPTYLPWLGYFDLIDQVDIFVFLDNVQVVKRSWHVRNRIKASQGELNLTIPIKKTKYRDKTLFCETHLNNEQNWRNKHVKSIELAYKKAPFFNEVYLFVKDLIECSESILSKFNINIIKKISSKMGICKELINALSRPIKTIPPKSHIPETTILLCYFLLEFKSIFFIIIFPFNL